MDALWSLILSSIPSLLVNVYILKTYCVPSICLGLKIRGERKNEIAGLVKLKLIGQKGIKLVNK